MIDVVWAGTSPESGRYEALETLSDIEVLNERFRALRARGEGYLEVRRVDAYPVLGMGFRGSVAVIQALMNEETTSILVGDGSYPGEEVKVPFMNEATRYSGQAGIDVDRAWDLLQAFLQGRDLSELGEWFEL